MNRGLAIRLAIGAVAVALLGWFAYAHMDQAVDLNLGLFTLRAIPLPIVLYGALIIGMLAMVGVSLLSDMRSPSASPKSLDKFDADVLGDLEEESKKEALEVDPRT